MFSSFYTRVCRLYSVAQSNVMCVYVWWKNPLFYWLLFFLVFIYYFLLFSTVPVETVYIMAGDRVELVCDVTSSAAYQHDGADGLAGYAPAAAAVISSRSSLKGLAAGQRRSSSGSYYSASRHHQSAGEHRRRNRRYNGNNNHHRRHSTSTAGYDHPSELTMDDGYLVLWFVDPDRKPFYRYFGWEMINWSIKQSGGGEFNSLISWLVSE